MGGEFWATFVYGFELREEYVRLRGKNVSIGSKSRGGYPVYYCIDYFRNELKINEIQNAISNLDQKTLDKMAEFDLFAAKYGYTASWQICCVGDFEVNYLSDTKHTVIQRLSEIPDIMKKYGDEIYNKYGGYTREMVESIEIILLEEGMGFMVKDAIQTTCIEDVIAMVNEFYSME